jgi:hypothetical protein
VTHRIELTTAPDNWTTTEKSYDPVAYKASVDKEMKRQAKVKKRALKYFAKKDAAGDDAAASKRVYDAELSDWERVGSATALVTFICGVSLHSSHANLTINMQLYTLHQ